MLKQARVIIASILLISSLGLTMLFWDRLPDSVANHFNAAGQADGYGPKKFMLLLFPGVEAFFCCLYAFALYTVRKPLNWKKRLRRPVSEENLEKIKMRGTGILDWAMLACMFLFLDVQVESYRVATRAAQKLSNLPMALIALMFVGVFYHIIRLFILQFQIIKEVRDGRPSDRNPPPGIS
jgi:uncharacterized membrane protein